MRGVSLGCGPGLSIVNHVSFGNRAFVQVWRGVGRCVSIGKRVSFGNTAFVQVCEEVGGMRSCAGN